MESALLSRRYPVGIPNLPDILTLSCHFCHECGTKQTKFYKKMVQSKELVTLRLRPLRNGGSALQLDYTVDGIRYREGLKMYLVPERNKIDKMQNIETMKMAIALKARKVLEIESGQAGLRPRGAKNVSLYEFMAQCKDEYEQRGSSYSTTMRNTMNFIEAFRGKETKISQVNGEYLRAFIKYLADSNLKPNTQHLYFNAVCIILNKAVKKGLIAESPAKKIDQKEKPRKEETIREFLTLDEVKYLSTTSCRNPELKQAFLFSCFTGLRISDIKQLRWEDIVEVNGRMQIQKTQQKTRGVVYIPISANAKRWMPERKTTGHVFPRVSEVVASTKISLTRWMKSTGIKKHITFHSARHTFATLALTYGTDIYTVSKLLGHKSVQVTQIYAKIIDEKKRQAVDSIPEIG